MADEKIITSSVFEQGITEIMQDIANNLYEFEEYTEEEVANLIDLSEEEVAELTRVINDTTVALNKVYSNKKVEELLTELEVACNKYADEKIGGLAGIHLAYVDTLPTTGEDNVIYILKSTTGGNDTLNLYNNGWISIGEFTISLDNYYDKVEVDALLNDKANKNEVFSQNDVVGDMSNISSSTVLSTAGLEVELNKKVDKDKIVTVLNDSATDEQVASALLTKTELDKTNAKLGDKADKSYVDDKVFEAIANPTELDTNKYIKSGYYSIGDATKRTNLPTLKVGTLLVYYAGHYVIQEYILNENLRRFMRRSIDKGKNWSDWQIVCDSTDITDLENRVTTNEADITDLENRVTTNEADITDLEKQTSDLQEQIDNLDIPEDVDLTEINDKLTQLENTINEVDDKVFETISNPTELDTDKYIKNGYYSIGDATKRTNLPTLKVGTLLVYYAGHYVIQEYILNENLRRFMRRSADKGANWSDWAELATMDKVCTTTVANVGVTTITPVNSAITGTIEYAVKNGICYVSMKDLMSTISSTGLLISTTMPKPAVNCNAVSVSSGGNVAIIYIDKNTTNLYGNFYDKNAKSYCSFSYPVAE